MWRLHFQTGAARHVTAVTCLPAVCPEQERFSRIVRPWRPGTTGHARTVAGDGDPFPTARAYTRKAYEAGGARRDPGTPSHLGPRKEPVRRSRVEANIDAASKPLPAEPEWAQAFTSCRSTSLRYVPPRSMSAA